MMFMQLKILEEETTCVKISESNLCCEVWIQIMYRHV